jgi:hypothetical protein
MINIFESADRAPQSSYGVTSLGDPKSIQVIFALNSSRVNEIHYFFDSYFNAINNMACLMCVSQTGLNTYEPIETAHTFDILQTPNPNETCLVCIAAANKQLRQKRNAEKRKLRYHTDPLYRQKIIIKQKEYHMRRCEDTKYRTDYLKRMAEYLKQKRQDPEYRKRQNSRLLERRKRKKLDLLISKSSESHSTDGDHTKTPDKSYCRDASSDKKSKIEIDNDANCNGLCFHQ